MTASVLEPARYNSTALEKHYKKASSQTVVINPAVRAVILNDDPSHICQNVHGYDEDGLTIDFQAKFTENYTNHNLQTEENLFFIYHQVGCTTAISIQGNFISFTFLHINSLKQMTNVLNNPVSLHNIISM